MQNMIKKVVEMDEKARQLEAQTQKEKIEIKENIEIQRQKVYDDYVSQARERAKRNDAIALAKANEKLEESRAKHQQAMEKMKAHYEANKETWVNELVSRVIYSE